MVVDNVLTSALAWDSFFGLSELGNGIIYQRTDDGEVVTSFTFKNLRDLLYQGLVITNKETDGTDTIFTFEGELIEPAVLRSKNEDKATITINDDLSGILSMRTSFIGKELV